MLGRGAPAARARGARSVGRKVRRVMLGLLYRRDAEKSLENAENGLRLGSLGGCGPSWGERRHFACFEANAGPSGFENAEKAWGRGALGICYNAAVGDWGREKGVGGWWLRGFSDLTKRSQFWADGFL